MIYTYPDAARGSPTVSPKNWLAAVSVATENIQALEVMARDDPEDPIPGNRFDFGTTLARPAPKHARQPERSLKFELLGIDDEPLTYEDVNVALLGLLNYAAVWDRGSKSDEIRMCTFELFYEDFGSPFAKGSVSLTAGSLAQAVTIS